MPDANENNFKPAKPAKVAKYFKRVAALFCGLFVLLVLFAGVLAWLVLTPSGLSAAAALAERLVPGLRLESIEGDLRDLRLKNLAFKMDGLDVSASGIELGIDLDALLDRKVRVTRLALSGVKTTVETQKLASAPTEPEPALSAPLDLAAIPDISLESVELADIDVTVDGHAIGLEHFAARADWARGQLALPTLTLRGARYGASGVEAGIERLETAFDWNGRVAALPKFVVEGIRAAFPGTEIRLERFLTAASADATIERVDGVQVAEVRFEGLDAHVQTAAQTSPAEEADKARASEVPKNADPQRELVDRAATGGSPETEGKAPQSDAALQKLEAPFPISVARIAIENAKAALDGHTVALERFETGLDWEASLLTVKPVRVTGLSAALAQTAPVKSEEKATENDKKPTERSVDAGLRQPAVRTQSASEAQSADGKKQGPGEMLEALFEKPLFTQLPTVALPLDIVLEGFEAADWTVSGLPGAEGIAPVSPWRLNRLAFRASAKDASVALEGLSLDSSALLMEADALVTMRDEWSAQLHAAASADIAPFAPALGLKKAPTTLEVDVSGEVLKKLSADVRLSGPVAASAHLGAELAAANLPFELRLTVPQAAWPLPGADLRAVTAEKAEPRTQKATAQAAGKAASENAKQNAQNTKAAKVAKATNATKASAAQKTVAKADGKAASGAASAVSPSRYELKGFEFAVGGSVKAWQATMQGKATVDMPSAGLKAPLAADLKLAAAGTPSRAAISDLSVTTEIGRVALSGNAEWLRNLAWHAQANVEGVDAKKLLPKLPLTLDVKTNAEGTVGLLDRPGSWRVALSNLSADGLIQGGLIRLRGAASADSDRHAEIPGLSFTLGKNNLELKGKADDVRNISLDLKVDVPGLLNTIPGLKGKASGYVRLSGSAFRPAVSADLRAQGIGWQDTFSVNDIRLKADVKNHVERRLRRSQPLAMPAARVTASASNIEAAKDAPNVSTAAAAPSGARGPMPPRKRPVFTAEQTMQHIADAIASGELEGSLRLNVTGIRVGTTSIDAVTFTTTGRETAMKLGLKVEGGPVEGEVGLSGGLNRNTLDWKGKLTGTHFATPAGGWSQKTDIPLDFRFAEMTLRVGKHCWTNEHAEVCVPEPMLLGRKGSAKLSLTKLDMAILKPYLRKRDRVSGTLTGEADMRWDLDREALPEVRVSIKGDGLHGQTRYQGIRFPLTLERLRLRAALEKGRASAGLEVRPEGNGLLTADFTVDDLMGERRLGGEMRIEDVTPSLLKPFLAQGETAEGRMNAALRAGGTLKAPELYGDFRLDDLSFDATYLPVDMKPSNLLLRFTGQRSELEAALKTGTGDVRITGDASWSDLNDWRAQLSVKSDKIRVAMPPMIEVDVETDVHAAATPALIELSGTVDIPWANITVGDLPASGTSVSKDEVILDENLERVATPGSPIALKSAILVRLGERVAIDAFGLKAGLKGGIHIVQNDDKLGLNGQISIPYGRFHAYGQDLIVQKGTVFFNGPAENPSLDIEAIRNPDVTEDGVTAGIRVGGTASNPKVTLFSEPAKSQSETLSYLIRGQGLGSDDEGGSSAMTSMLIGLGATTGNGIMSEIGDTLGIKGLGLDTTGVGENSQVVVSGYVLPGLQVKYGVGIFDSLATLTLRYRLMPRLYLEAVSSVDQALDLLYRFDF